MNSITRSITAERHVDFHRYRFVAVPADRSLNLITRFASGQYFVRFGPRPPDALPEGQASTVHRSDVKHELSLEERAVRSSTAFLHTSSLKSNCSQKLTLAMAGEAQPPVVCEHPAHVSVVNIDFDYFSRHSEG